MKERTLIPCFVLAITLCCCGGARQLQEHPPPSPYEGMALAWSDEFNGRELNEESWNYEIGDGCPRICGWGNNQLQYYTRENTRLKDGRLIITAREESKEGYHYTSSRIQTAGKRMFKFGRIDIRAKLPEGKGIWPALWMLGASRYTVGWPACGEIDIMELAGNIPDQVQGSAHYKGPEGLQSSKNLYTLPEGTFANGFHVFSLHWQKDKIEWLVDGKKFHEVSRDGIEAAEYPFDEEFYFIFNLAVGGNWRSGNPNGSTSFPQRMEVDYIRVYQEKQALTE